MHARIIKQIFDSSIASDWQTRHVFMDMILLADSQGVVDIPFDVLAGRMKVAVEVVKVAVGKLCLPDPHSRNAAESGARLVRLDAESEYGWRIVNFQQYNPIGAVQRRRAYMQGYMQKYRKRKAPKKTKTKVRSKEKVAQEKTDFERFYEAYPRKVGVTAARRKWEVISKKDGFPGIEAILSAVADQKTWPSWMKGGGEFIPNPKTWLNQGRWADKPTTQAAQLPFSQRLKDIRQGEDGDS